MPSALWPTLLPHKENFGLKRICHFPTVQLMNQLIDFHVTCYEHCVQNNAIDLHLNFLKC